MGKVRKIMDKPAEYMKSFIDHLGKSLLEDLKEEIPKHLETLVDIRFKGLKDGLEPLKDISSKLIEQGNDIENLQLSYKHLSDEFESFRKKQQGIPQQVKETIEKSMEEGQNQMVDVIAGQLEQIPTKPNKPIATVKKKKRFLFF